MGLWLKKKKSGRLGLFNKDYHMIFSFNKYEKISYEPSTSKKTY